MNGAKAAEDPDESGFSAALAPFIHRGISSEFGALRLLTSGATRSFLRIDENAVVDHHGEIVLSVAGEVRHDRFARLG